MCKKPPFRGNEKGEKGSETVEKDEGLPSVGVVGSQDGAFGLNPLNGLDSLGV